MMRKLSSILQGRKILLIACTAILLVGIIFGVIAGMLLQPEKLVALSQYLTQRLDTVALYKGQDVARQLAMEANMWDIGKLFFLGVSIIGIPLIVVVVFVKGFSIGFVLCFMMINYGLAAIEAIIISIVIPKLLYIPFFIIASYYAIGFSFTVLNTTWPELMKHFIKFTLAMLMITAITCAIGYLEGYLSIYGIENILQ